MPKSPKENKTPSKKLTTRILIGILLVAAIIRFWDINGPDIMGDDVLYSMRGIGYFDYVGSTNTQTTPVVWFPERVWWQGLSFHDAPPLVFAIQWFFFQFGNSLFWARLPFILAGLAAIYFVFLAGKELKDTTVGLIAAGSLAIMNYHTWISRIGLLDGFVMLFVTASFYFFLRAKEKPIFYLWWGIACGLGILSKYTFLFIMPAFLIMLLIWYRVAWRSKWLYAGIIAIVALILPVVIYNTMMWKTRGHPDAALSTLFGMQPEDFYGLDRTAHTEAGILRGLIRGIASRMSYGFGGVVLLSLILYAFSSFRDKERKAAHYFFWICIVWALIMLVLVGGSDQFAVVLLPFFAWAVGMGGMFFWKQGGFGERILCAILVVPLVIWELVFTLQSHAFVNPLVAHPWLSDAERPKRLGYNELEKYVKEFYKEFPNPSYVVYAVTPQIRNYQIAKIQSWYERGEDRPQQTNMLVYDNRMDWTPAVWTFERRRLYEVAGIPSLSNLVDAIEGDYLNKFQEFGFRDVTIILKTDKMPTNLAIESKKLDIIAAGIRSTTQPKELIHNHKGEVVFEVFRFPLNDELKKLMQ